MPTHTKLLAVTSESQALLERGRKLKTAPGMRASSEQRKQVTDECAEIAEQLTGLIAAELGTGVRLYVRGDADSDTAAYYCASPDGDLDREEKHPGWWSGDHNCASHMRNGSLAIRELHARTLLTELPLLFERTDQFQA